jgi:hypothetical protein
MSIHILYIPNHVIICYDFWYEGCAVKFDKLHFSLYFLYCNTLN